MVQKADWHCVQFVRFNSFYVYLFYLTALTSLKLIFSSLQLSPKVHGMLNVLLHIKGLFGTVSYHLSNVLPQ